MLLKKKNMREESNFSKEIMGEYRPNQKNIVYFHGLSSSGNSRTGRKLKELFPNEIVITPDIPVNPKNALPFLKNLVSNLDDFASFDGYHQLSPENIENVLIPLIKKKLVL